jgi:hypothetical protein
VIDYDVIAIGGGARDEHRAAAAAACGRARGREDGNPVEVWEES